MVYKKTKRSKRSKRSKKSKRSKRKHITKKIYKKNKYGGRDINDIRRNINELNSNIDFLKNEGQDVSELEEELMELLTELNGFERSLSTNKKIPKILVLGGGIPELYDDNFYTVGDHPSSDFGSGKDWNNIDFWSELHEELVKINIKFKAVIFDAGSESWFEKISKNAEFYNILYLILTECTNEDGLMILSTKFADRSISQVAEMIDQDYPLIKKISSFRLNKPEFEQCDIYSVKKKILMKYKL